MPHAGYITRDVRRILDAGAFPILIGGDHPSRIRWSALQIVEGREGVGWLAARLLVLIVRQCYVSRRVPRLPTMEALSGLAGAKRASPVP